MSNWKIIGINVHPALRVGDIVRVNNGYETAEYELNEFNIERGFVITGHNETASLQYPNYGVFPEVKIRTAEEKREFIKRQERELEAEDRALWDQREVIEGKLEALKVEFQELCPHTNTSTQVHHAEGGGMEHIRSYAYQVKKCEDCEKTLGTRYEDSGWGEWQ
jgi:hypothetical protein